MLFKAFALYHFLVLTFISSVSFSYANLNLCQSTLSLLKVIPNDTYAFSHLDKAQYEIKKVEGLEHTYLAIFNHKVYMNLALGRATTYLTQGKIISDLSLKRSNSQVQNFGGHDFSAEFITQYLKIRPKTDVKIEEEFWSHSILDVLQKDPEAILIAGSLTYQSKRIISHETLHARFYESPELQAKVRKFWNEKVSKEDKDLYLEVLKREKYDITNEELVLNEFFAYTLEEGEPMFFPPSLIERYQKGLSSMINR